MKKIIRNIIIVAVIALVAYVGYSVFFKSKAPVQPALVTTSGAADLSGTATTGGDIALGKEFLTLLLNVRSLKLDDKIFSNQAFVALQDFSRPIPPDVNPGRPNPFAPIGTDSTSVSTQISTSNPSSVTSTASTLNGALNIADASVTRWFEYGLTNALGTKTTVKSQANPGVFAESITGLQPNTTYYVKAFASIGGTVIAGNLVSWKTAQ